MKVIEKAIEAEFKGHCDLSKQEDRIAFLGVAISIWEKYDIKEIRRVLKDLSDLTELAERDGTFAEQAKCMKMVERLCKKCDKHCNHKKTAHSSTTIHKGEDGITATIDAGGMSEEEIRKEIDRALGLIFEKLPDKLPDNDEEEEDD